FRRPWTPGDCDGAIRALLNSPLRASPRPKATILLAGFQTEFPGCADRLWTIPTRDGNCTCCATDSGAEVRKLGFNRTIDDGEVVTNALVNLLPIRARAGPALGGSAYFRVPSG